jgi:hypothetical protein
MMESTPDEGTRQGILASPRARTQFLSCILTAETEARGRW